MKKAELVTWDYEPSDNAQVQGSYDDIKTYLERGFFEKENRNGYHILYKPVRVLVTLKNDTETKTFNMKDTICSVCGRSRISQKACDEFISGVDAGEINLFLEDGEYSVCKAK